LRKEKKTVNHLCYISLCKRGGGDGDRLKKKKNEGTLAEERESYSICEKKGLDDLTNGIKEVAMKRSLGPRENKS